MNKPYDYVLELIQRYLQFDLFISLACTCEKSEKLVKQVYKVIKHHIEDEVSKDYDEAYFCTALTRFLDSLHQAQVRDQRLTKLARQAVIYILKFNFGKTPQVIQYVLPLTVAVCRIFPLPESNTPQDQINQVLGLLPALKPHSKDVLRACEAILGCDIDFTTLFRTLNLLQNLMLNNELTEEHDRGLQIYQ